MKEKYAICLTLPHDVIFRVMLVGQWFDSKQSPDIQATNFCLKAQVGALQEGVEILLYNADYNSDEPKKPSEIMLQKGNSFQDESGWSVVENLDGYRVLPRTYWGLNELVIARINELGGVSELAKTDLDGIVDWPVMLSEEFTKRRMVIVPYKDLGTVVQSYAIEGKVFVKTKIKQVRGQGLTINVNELNDYLQNNQLPYNYTDTSGKGEKKVITLSDQNIDMIVSEPVEFSRIGHDIFSNEYRAFVINSKVAHMHNYRLPEDENVPNDAKQFACYFAEQNQSVLPKHYVFDIGMLKDNTYCIVEVNPFICSAGLSRRGTRRVLKMLGYSTFSIKSWIRTYSDLAQKVDKLPV